jgi:hypothetical protein
MRRVFTPLKLRNRRLRSATALALLVIAAGCATVEKTVVADPGVAFALPLGKVATVNGNGARITFNRVTDDSRCPTDIGASGPVTRRSSSSSRPGGNSSEQCVSLFRPVADARGAEKAA